MPITTEPKMNHTEGWKNSLNASSAPWIGLGSPTSITSGRIRNSAWTTAMVMLVTPIGTTSNTHHTAASRNIPSAAFPWALSWKASPVGSMAAGQGGDRWTRRNSATPRPR
jgi:hypothetical protein